MDLRKLKTLIDLVSESNVSELEITEAEGKVRIVKSSGVPVMMHQPGMTMMQAPVMAATVAAPEVPAAEPVGHAVKSPMVGTFYRSSGTVSKILCENGQAVEYGQALFIIE